MQYSMIFVNTMYLYDAPKEYRTRMLIQYEKLLYIVKGKWAPG